MTSRLPRASNYGCLQRIPRRFHPAWLCRVRPKTVEIYRAAVGLLVSWILLHQLPLHTIQDVDEALCEWQLDEGISVHKFGTTVSAIEFAFPED